MSEPRPQEPELPILDLNTLGGGAAFELFQAELERVLENVLDPNTEATDKREVQLVVTIKPTAERTEGVVLVRAKSKLAATRGAGGTIFVGRKRGQAVATTFNPKQQQFAWDAEGKPQALRETGTE